MNAIKTWFEGFEKGICRLSPTERESFFCECGKNCVQNGVLPIYRQLYADVDGDLDAFFTKANEFDGVRGEVVEHGKSYNLCFTDCVCPLHQSGYVRTPLLCECSRQSVLYTMHTLWKDKKFEVTLCGTILRGNDTCQLHIKVLDKSDAHTLQPHSAII